MSIFTSFLRKAQGAEPGALPTEASGPPLVLLLPDASGIASYRLFAFPTAVDAERFIDSHLRGKITEDTVLFWGLSEPPAEASETVVLVRSDRPGSAHAFSFTDLATATDFVRHEMNFGLTLERVLIFWTSGASLRVDTFGRSAVFPPVAPRLRTLVAPAASFYAPPEQAVAAGHAETAVDPETADTPPVNNSFDHKVIEFPAIPGRFRLQSDTSAWWRNMVDAMDEALDAYVARRVTDTLVWSRLSREVAVAAAMQEAMPPGTGEGRHAPGNASPPGNPAEDVTDAVADEDSPDTGDDPWFVPRPEWRKRPDGPFNGFGSPHGRF